MKLKKLLFALLAASMTVGSAWADNGVTPVSFNWGANGGNTSGTISFNGLNNVAGSITAGGGYESSYPRYNYWIELAGSTSCMNYGYRLMKFEWSVPSYTKAHVTIPTLAIHLYNYAYATESVACLSALYEFDSQSEAQSASVSTEPSAISAYASGTAVPYSSHLIRYAYNSGAKQAVAANSGGSYTTVFDNSTNSTDNTMDKYWLYTTCSAKGTRKQTSYMLLYPNSAGEYYTVKYDYYKRISFDANSGFGTMEIQVVENSGTLSKNSFTHPCATFVGWNTKADGSGTSYADGARITATLSDKGMLKLYAQWKFSAHTFTNHPDKDMCDKCHRAFLRYTTTDGKIMTPNTALYENMGFFDADGNRVSIVSNTYSNGQGVMEFNGPVMRIGWASFSENPTLTGDLVIPSTVEVLDEGAFQNVTNLNGTLKIPSSVTSLGGSVFSRTPFSKIIMGSIPHCVGHDFYLDAGRDDSTIEYSLNDDSYVYTDYDIERPKAGALNFKRTTKKKFETMVLPFSVSVRGITPYVYKFSKVESGHVYYYREFNSISAGTPFLVMCTEDPDANGNYNYTLTANNTEIKTSLNDINLTDDISFCGTFSPVDLSGEDGYFVDENGKLVAIAEAGSQTLSPFHAYFKASSSLTGISEICSDGHAFPDDDPTYSVCERCGHGFFRYTSTDENKVLPNDASVLKDAKGRELVIISHTYSDGQGVIEFNAPVFEIGKVAFKNCTTLGPLELPTSLATIGDEAFSGCSGVTNTILHSFPSVGTDAFSGTSSNICMNLNDESYVSDGSNENMLDLSSISYYRVTKNREETLVVPFAVNIDGSEPYELHTVQGFANHKLIANEDKVTGVVPAGTLLLVNATGVAGSNGAYNYTVTASDNVINTSLKETVLKKDSVSILGSYKSLTTDGCSTFCYENGKIIISNKVVKPFHAYLRVSLGLTCAIVGHRFSDDDPYGDVCPYCNHGLFHYRSSTGTAVDPNNIERFWGSDGKTLTFIGNTYNEEDGGILEFSAPIVTIAADAFANCSQYTGELRIPQTVKTIERGAFYGCKGFTKLILPDNLSCINEYTFVGCSTLAGSLKIPKSVTRIDQCAFFGCSGFTGTLTIPENVTSIGTAAFWGCSGFTGTLTIPEKVTSIYESTFFGCSGFTGILTIPESITSVGKYAFQGCSGLESLSIPNSITSIGDAAFSGCSGFESLIIPNTVTSIGDAAFSGCTGLKEVNFASVPKFGTDAFLNVPNSLIFTLSDDSYVCGDQEISGLSSLSTFTRITKNQMETFVVPFELNITGDEPYNLYRVMRVESDKVYVYKVIGTVPAGTPVVIRYSGDADADGNYHYIFSANDHNLKTSISNVKFMDGTNSFCGTFSTVDLTDVEGCVVENGNIVSIDEAKSKSLSPFRAYFKGLTTLKEITEEVHTFADDDEARCVCTTCGHGFFRYESSDGNIVEPKDASEIKGADGKTLTILSNICQDNYGVIEFNAPIIELGNEAFYARVTLTGSLIIPYTVTRLGQRVFEYSKMNGTVKLPASVQAIELEAFRACSNIKEMEMRSIPNIGTNAFDVTDFNINLNLSDNSYINTESNENFPKLTTETYTRSNFKNQWGTIVVPFALSLDGTESYDLYTVSDIADGEITITQTTELAAGTPALIRMRDRAKK